MKGNFKSPFASQMCDMIARWPVGEWIPQREADNLVRGRISATNAYRRIRWGMRFDFIEQRWPDGFAPGSAQPQTRPPVLYRPTEKGVAWARERLKRWWRTEGLGV